MAFIYGLCSRQSASYAQAARGSGLRREEADDGRGIILAAAKNLPVPCTEAGKLVNAQSFAGRFWLFATRWKAGVFLRERVKDLQLLL